MLRIDDQNRQMVPLPATIMSHENLLERGDIQDLLVRSWDAFVEELGFPTLRFLGQEVQPHESVSNRIDILSFDEEDGMPVVIELKRDRHKLHLLQALSYAAMVWTWDEATLKEIAGDDADDDLVNSIENRSEDASPRIILIAEDYDPEVILTADWLSAQHAVDIYCFSVWMQRHGDDRLVRFQLDYPLRELQDVYRTRRRAARSSPPATPGQTWDDVKQWIDFDWGAWFIDICRESRDGDPRRRRFSGLFTGEWGSYYPHIHRKDVTIYTRGRRDGDIEHFKQSIPGAEVKAWGSDQSTSKGLTIKLTTRQQAQTFLKTVGHYSEDL
jgi:hypothetical protein